MRQNEGSRPLRRGTASKIARNRLGHGRRRVTGRSTSSSGEKERARQCGSLSRNEQAVSRSSANSKIRRRKRSFGPSMESRGKWVQKPSEPSSKVSLLIMAESSLTMKPLSAQFTSLVHAPTFTTLTPIHLGSEGVTRMRIASSDASFQRVVISVSIPARRSKRSRTGSIITHAKY